MSDAARWVENRPARDRWPRLELREAWAFREVGLILAQRDIKVRYKQTYFGVAWAVLQPLLAMVVFTLVLGRIPNLSAGGIPYSAFVISGLAVWYPFATAIAGAAESLVSAPELVTKVYFPRILAPLGAVLAAGVDLAVALGLSIVVALIAGVSIPATVALIPVTVVVAIFVAFGLSLWLAALNVLYRDVRHAVPFFLQLLFFASPILYSAHAVDQRFEWVLALNPITAPAELWRWSLLGTDIRGGDVLVSLGMTAVLLAGGLAFFRWAERQFADRI
jgi:ABC-type polysaccharide/polyol phosphate export permease